jgi:glycosyltransferase involved in cell wall biosynthesis
MLNPNDSRFMENDIPLKVVHLAASVRAGGAATAVLNLHKGLCRVGVNSSILTGDGNPSGSPLRIIRNPFDGINRLVYRELIHRNRTPLSNTHFSFDTGGIFLNSEPEVLEADVIHLHWVANYLSTSSLSALASIGKPVLWTLHDMRPFTGGCHFSAGCEGFRQECQSCPQLQPTLHHFPARAHIGQTKALRLLEPVFVSPSRWLANECTNSSVASSCRVEVIPYGIDVEAFAPMPQQEARRRLGLHQEALYIMLGAHSFEEQRKGGFLAQQALHQLAQHSSTAEAVSTGDWRVVSCGADNIRLDAPWRLEHLGYLSERDMAALYAACNVLLFTSKEDNFPNMILEAMACGLPVVAYGVGGVPELVEHGKIGFLADPFDASSLCEHLTTILRSSELRQGMGQNARKAVTNSFTLDAQARLHRDLYARQIARKSEMPLVTTLIPDANVDSIDFALNAFEQKREALTEESIALGQEKIALTEENIALTKENIALKEARIAFTEANIALNQQKVALTREKVALEEENRVLARVKSDLHSELSRLRKWNHYLRRQSLVEFVSQNSRSRWRLARKRAVYLREKRRHIQYLLGKLRFRVTHFRWRDVVWLRNVVDLTNVVWLKNVVHPLHIWLEKHLGAFEQYQPRPLRHEVYPTFHNEGDQFPSMTIVTPSYNQATFLERTIESVISQAYPHLEYAVVDGGSTDGSKEILEKYRSGLAYAVSEADEGQAHAIVKGFSNTHGEIMAYLNSDDCLMPGALRYIGRYFRQHPEVDVIYGHRVIIDQDGLEIGRWVIPPHDAECVRRFDYIPQETLFWRRHFYEKVGGLDVRFHFALDWDLILKFMRAGARFRRLPYFLACFRMHCEQKTSSLLQSTGRNEMDILMGREFPRGDHQRNWWLYHDRYRLVSTFCGSLLRCGIRI